MTTPRFRSLRPTPGNRDTAARRRADRRSRPSIEAMEGRQLLSTFTVSNLGDNPAGTADIPGSLRDAIDQANAAPVGTVATINFAIGTGPQTIALLQPLPTLANPMIINGATQPGYAGRPIVEIDGTNAGAGAVGFSLDDDSHNSTIEGLEVNAFSGGGILIDNGTFDTIANDVVGLHVVTNLSRAKGDGTFGVEVRDQANNNTFTNLVVAGNPNNGVVINNSMDNTLTGSDLGTDATGADTLDRNGAPLGNGSSGGGTGVILNGSANHNTISGNVIANNLTYGVLITDPGTSQNTLTNNKIGTNAAGTAALGNAADGVALLNGATSNAIGLPGKGNLISGNGHSGIDITSTPGGTTATGFNSLAGNKIGTNLAGTAAIPNAQDGVVVTSGSVGNAIGTTAAGGGNLISGNGTWGVFITGAGTALNVVQNDLIGTDVTGTKGLGNHNNGIDILNGAQANTVGGTTAAARNVVSGNVFEGVLINDPGTSKNVVEGDFIGTDPTGSFAVPNGDAGVYLGNGATNNLIGGLPNNAPFNLISGNAGNGVFITGNGTSGNSIDGNNIGVDASGVRALGNRGDGVLIQPGANGNVVGAVVSSIKTRNIISGNAGDGVQVDSTGNQVAFNAIGVDAGGQLPLGNGGNGVTLGASGNTANLSLIGDNAGYGILSQQPGGNVFFADSIFGNTLGGIQILNDPGATPRPILTGVVGSGGKTTVYGTIASQSSTRAGTLTFQFYTSPYSIAPASIQGKTFVGQGTATTDANGLVNFAITLNTAIPTGQVVTATTIDPNFLSSMFSNPVVVAAPPATANFLGIDTQTQGNWKGNYGQDGYDLAQDPSTNNPKLPAYAAVALAGNSNFTFTTTSTDPRALQEAGSTTNRVAGVWYSPTTFSINVNLSDGMPHRVTLYALDFDNHNRSERIDVLDRTTGAVLDSQTLSSFTGGRYLNWSLTGNVTFLVTNLVPNNNAVIDGVFFGGTITAPGGAGHDTDDPILPQLSATPLEAVSTVPGNGDQNPYGVAYVPPTFPKGGKINPGDLLVSNFNDKANRPGTGSTIVRITPSGQRSTFFQGAPGLGLTTALGVLGRGFVVVGSMPTTAKGSAHAVHAGSLLILDKSGHVVANLANSKLLDGPWGLAVDDRGATASVFVSNVLNGTITRIDLAIPATGSKIKVTKEVQIASGYAHKLDPAALVLGPAGLAFDSAHDVLYVASTADNAIFAVPNAGRNTASHGRGKLVTKDAVHLHGPLGLALASNGDLVVADSDGVNADPRQPSEVVEFSPAGKFLSQLSIDPRMGAAPFGLAISTAQGRLQLAVVNDNANQVDVFAWPKPARK